MARASGVVLDVGDRFPEYAVTTLEDGMLSVPAGLGQGYKVVLLYRGHW